MVVKESIETAFGTVVKGVTIQMTVEEAQAVQKVLAQGISNPPKTRDGFNTDYASRDIAIGLSAELREIWEG